MGSSSWSDDFYADRAAAKKATGTPTFTHDADVRSGKAASALHDKLNPKGVTRESRDSAAHPESTAIAVFFDVTGSMGSVPRVLQEKLPQLMGLLCRKGYIKDPQILFGAFGDATCDRVALQVGQFESGVEMDEDITRIYLERMADPNGLKAGDYDTVFAGATSARFSALQSGAVDAAILLPPFNFYAESAGFTNLGLTVDYAKELPFTGTVVGRAWASAHKATLEKVLSVNAKSVAWFSDPANRAEAIDIMVEASKLKQEDVARSYDFLHKNEFFETAGRVSKAKMGALLAALKGLGDIEGSTNLERFVLPGVTQLSD